MSETRVTNPTVKLYGRLSYPSLFTARKDPTDTDPTKKPKFEATIIMRKKEEASFIAALKKAIDEVRKSPILKGKKPGKICLRDGADTEARAEADGYGSDVMTVGARNHRRPAVVDRDLTPLTEEDGKLFPGCFVNVTVEVYPYYHPKSGPGIAASLRAIQYVKKGEPLGEAPVSAEKEFEALPQEEEDAVV